MERPLYAQRLARDVSDVLSHDFSSSSAVISVTPPRDYRLTSGITVDICILEGPYRGGHFSFILMIPDNYPFRGVDVWSTKPMWHPNIDINSGRVVLPLEWSPVLTLTSITLAIQMILLEPSAENPLNLDACSYYCSDPMSFDDHVQRTFRGCHIEGVRLISMRNVECQNCGSNCSTWKEDAAINYEENFEFENSEESICPGRISRMSSKRSCNQSYMDENLDIYNNSDFAMSCDARTVQMESPTITGNFQGIDTRASTKFSFLEKFSRDSSMQLPCTSLKDTSENESVNGIMSVEGDGNDCHGVSSTDSINMVVDAIPLIQNFKRMRHDDYL